MKFRPTVRFAVMSDLHYEESKPHLRERFRRAMERIYAYADGEEYSALDALYIVGDFTNRGQRWEMEAVREDCDAALREGTRLVVTMANHDMHYVEDDRAAMADFKEIFGMDYDRHEKMGGYHFISLSTTKYQTPWHDSFDEEKRAYLRCELEKARKDTGNRPIFVFQHPGNRDTVLGGSLGDTEIYPILSDFPQVIDFSGHSHFPVNDPRETHQGHFTSVSTGSLAYIKYGPKRANCHVDSSDIHWEDYAHMLLVEGDAEGRVRIRYFDAATGEFFQNERIFENVHDRARHAYTKQRAAAAEPPRFPEGAGVAVTRTEADVTLSFPAAHSTGDGILEYYVRLLDENGTAVAQKSVYSDFMTTKKRERFEVTLPHHGAACVEIYAVGFWDECSLPLTAKFA